MSKAEKSFNESDLKRGNFEQEEIEIDSIEIGDHILRSVEDKDIRVNGEVSTAGEKRNNRGRIMPEAESSSLKAKKVRGSGMNGEILREAENSFVQADKVSSSVSVLHDSKDSYVLADRGLPGFVGDSVGSVFASKRLTANWLEQDWDEEFAEDFMENSTTVFTFDDLPGTVQVKGNSWYNKYQVWNRLENLIKERTTDSYFRPLEVFELPDEIRRVQTVKAELDHLQDWYNELENEVDEFRTFKDIFDIELEGSNEERYEDLQELDKTIEKYLVEDWNIDENVASAFTETDEPARIGDSIPEEFDSRAKEDYLRIATGTLDSNLDISVDIGTLERIKSDAKNLFTTEEIETSYKAQIANKIEKDVPKEDDSKRKKISSFLGTVEELSDDHTNELFSILETEKDKAVVAGEVNEHGQKVEYSDGDDKFGNNIVDIAVNRGYSFFVDDEAEKIEDLLETKGDLPETDPFFEEESPYKEIVEELSSSERLENGEESEYGEMSDQELAEKLRMVRGLGERLGFDYEASNVFGMLKGKEGQRQNTDFEPDEEEIESLLANRREELEQDVQNKLREYVKQGIQNLGFESAVDEYEEATGERTEELNENELAALKVRKRQGGKRGIKETVDTLLEHQNDIYELEANQEWLEEHKFSQGELIDPDLSTQTDGEYRRPEDPEHNSELQVEVDPSDVQVDTEMEKQQYWDEVTELLDRVGVEDEVEDIEGAEQAIEELEEPEDEQDYQELKDAVNNYRSVENRAGGIPDELTLRVADPMDTTRMGQGFGSCHDIDGGSYAWASISNAVDANKMVFYAEDEQGRERARVKAFITEDEELIYHNTSQYKDIDIDTSDYFEGYMERVSDELGLELKHSSEASGWEQRTELLEAHDWYSGS